MTYRSMAALVSFDSRVTAANGLGAAPVAGVKIEDPLHGAGLDRLRDEPVGVAVDAVAERAGATGPQPFGGLAFHAVDELVNDRFAFGLLGC